MSVKRSLERHREERLPAGRQGLTVRRRQGRRRARVAFFILFLLLFVAAVYGLNQSTVRVSHIEIYGGDSALVDVVKGAMQGSYLGLIPRDSTFFIPKSRIRAGILAFDSNIAAVSLFRTSLIGLSIKVDTRAPIARWCGDATRFNLENSDVRLNLVASCYLFDASGVIYAAAATSTATINPFTLYAPLVGDKQEPLQATIAHTNQLPATFDFARSFAAFGAPVDHIVIEGDEVSFYLVWGTRITYVLGHEQAAYAALVSARDYLNLANGSLEYVDLRFDGKVYSKKKE